MLPKIHTLRGYSRIGTRIAIVWSAYLALAAVAAATLHAQNTGWTPEYGIQHPASGTGDPHPEDSDEVRKEMAGGTDNWCYNQITCPDGTCPTPAAGTANDDEQTSDGTGGGAKLAPGGNKTGGGFKMKGGGNGCKGCGQTSGGGGVASLAMPMVLSEEAASEFPVTPYISSGLSFTHLLTHAYYHWADDLPAGPLGGLQLRRHYRSRDLLSLGSFGPGWFSNFDLRLQLGDDSISTQAPFGQTSSISFFDPAALRNQGFIAPVSSNPGTLTAVTRSRARDIRLLDDQMNEITTVNWELNWHGAKYAALHNWQDDIFLFELVKANAEPQWERGNGEGMYDPLDGRLVKIQSRKGYSFNITYKTWSAAQIAESPTRLFQIDTVTDPAGHQIAFHYAAQTVAGRWVVSQIDCPGGGSIQYAYGATGLSGITYPDGRQSTFSIGDPDLAVNNLSRYTIHDLAAEPGHRHKVAYLQGLLLQVGEEWVPTSTGRLQFLLNGSGEMAYGMFGFSGIWFYEGGGRARYFGNYLRDNWQTTGTPGIYVRPSGSAERYTESLEGTNAQLLANHVTAYNDPRGVKYRYEYDTDNWVTQVTYEDNTFETRCYNSRHQVTRARDREGHVTKSVYDSLGNLIERHVGLKDHPSNTGTGGYGGTYNRCATNDVQTPEYAVHHWEYYPVGHALQGLKSAYINPLGKRTDYQYDAQHRLVKVIQPPDVVGGPRAETTYTYDAGARLKTVTDPLGHVVEYFYDVAGRLISTLYEDGTSDKIVYGTTGASAGLVVKTIDRMGVVTNYEYDASDRLTRKVTAAAVVVGGTETATPEVAFEDTYTYINGTGHIKAHRAAGALTEYGYDYRGRRVTTVTYPRVGTQLVAKQTYIDNQLFCSEDPYGRKTYYAYDASDGRLIRSITGTVPEYSIPATVPGNPNYDPFAAVLAMTRNLAPNATYIVHDNVLSAAGHIVQSFNGRQIEMALMHNTVGRETVQIAAKGTPVEARTETSYDLAGHVIERRAPRYFDTSDTRGNNKAKETWTFTGRGLVATHAEAPTTTEGATESFTYDLSGRRLIHTDYRGQLWKSHFIACCGQTLASENPLGHGSIRNSDAAGRPVHEIVVGNYSQHTSNLNDPVNAQTYRETTTRYDHRGRPVARTVWLNARGPIDVNNPAIAGLGGIPLAEGLTEQFLYDDNLTDGVGLESATGVSPTLGGTARSLAGALAKLADTQSNGGAGITFGANRPGSARIVINAEGNASFSISDAVGRAVMTGQLDGNNQLITWSSSLHDVTANFGGYGTLLETKTINALGKARRQQTDGAGRTMRFLDELGQATVMSYNASANILSVRDPNNVGHDTVYDALGRPGLVTDTVGHTTNSTYDRAGSKIAAIDGKGHATTYTFDARGRQVKITDRLGGNTTFAYLPTGQLAELTDAENQVTTHTYDNAGNELTEQYPDHVPGSAPGNAGCGVITLTRDPVGRILSKQDQQGDTCAHAYDLAGRLLSRVYTGYASGPLAGQSDTDAFTYDRAGRMVTATSGRYANMVSFTYDTAGRKETEALTISGQTYMAAVHYNVASQIVSYTYPDGTEVTRGYTDRGELATIGYDGATIDTRTYDNGGRMLTSAYNNGVSETRTYNADNTLQGIAFSGAPIGDFSYTWDANKNKTSESITGVMSDYGFTVPSGGYDVEDRLIGYQRTDNNFNQWFNLSAVGDWNSVTTNGTTQSRTHGLAHELLNAGGQAVQYDTKGNATLIPAAIRPNFMPLKLSWDFDNRLSTADIGNDGSTDLIYKWDALGRRVYYHGDAGEKVSFQVGQQTIANYVAGSVASSSICTFVYGSYIDEPIIQASDGVVTYYHRNQLYSTIATSDSGAQITERYTYDTYGTPREFDANGFIANSLQPSAPFLYTGREWVPELTMYHYRFRHYSPQVGRFSTRDLIEITHDGPSRYQYVRSNPLSLTDPYGLFSDQIDAAGAACPEDHKCLVAVCAICGDPNWENNLIDDFFGGNRVRPPATGHAAICWNCTTVPAEVLGGLNIPHTLNKDCVGFYSRGPIAGTQGVFLADFDKMKQKCSAAYKFRLCPSTLEKLFQDMWTDFRNPPEYNVLGGGNGKSENCTTWACRKLINAGIPCPLMVDPRTICNDPNSTKR